MVGTLLTAALNQAATSPVSDEGTEAQGNGTGCCSSSLGLFLECCAQPATPCPPVPGSVSTYRFTCRVRHLKMQ